MRVVPAARGTSGHRTKARPNEASLLLRFVLGVPRVVGWYEGPFAFACDEGVAEAGLEVVAMGAEPVAFVEPGVMGLAPLFPVVELDPLHTRAVERRALRG